MLTGRKILVTGGSEGIGFACAKKAIEYGAKVCIMSRSEAKLTAAQEKLGPNCCWVSADAGDSDAVKAAVEKAAEQMGGLDGAINSAGAALIGPIEDLDDDCWNFTINLCLSGIMRSDREEARIMIDNDVKNGSIVNISSLNGEVPYKQMSPYTAAKGGVNMLTKTACLDLAQYGIRVNAVMPGFTDTQMMDTYKAFPEAMKQIMRHTPLKRLGKPEEIAEVAAFLLSDRASFVNGECIMVDGGMQNTAYPDVWSAMMGWDDEDEDDE